MRNWTDHRDLQERRLPTENLKCCPLCGVLNAVQNGECFVCGWHGRFEHDPDLIEESLLELLDRCPELAEAMIDQEPHASAPWWRRAVDRVLGVFHRRVDLRV